MERVFIVYTADANLWKDSYNLMAVCTTKQKAIDLITPKLIEACKAEYNDAFRYASRP